ncbi:unnamed protein product [Clonostachys rosea]|uniref:Extracellular membrane protein CFEM domain-containing protein n=1 Tax=Bionectria ochroleuca TaxID=29856 RepID=A0ABY6U761_BIOOC|nr:unnamed protein product [Clonostachys rosea]
MHFASGFVTLLVAASVSASGPVHEMNGVGYDTYCCTTVTSYSLSCSRGRCSNAPCWSCIISPGKIESIKYCMSEVGGNKSLCCKKPERKFWIRFRMGRSLVCTDARTLQLPPVSPTGNAPILDDEVKCEKETEEGGDGFEMELRKREPDYDETDMV